MQVDVTFRHMNSTDAIKDFATERVSRASRLLTRGPLTARVVLSVEKNEQRAEVELSGAGMRFYADDRGDDLYKAIDQATTKVEAQVRKHHDKQSDHS